MKALELEGIPSRPGTHSVTSSSYYTKKYNIEPKNYPIASMLEDTTITCLYSLG